MTGVNVWWVNLAPQNIPVQLYWHLAIKLYRIVLVENEHLKCPPKRRLICKVVGNSNKQCCCADLNEHIHYMPVLFKTPIFQLIQVSENWASTPTLRWGGMMGTGRTQRSGGRAGKRKYCFSWKLCWESREHRLEKVDQKKRFSC